MDAIRNCGGSLMARGTSDGIIGLSSDGYLWETMLYFFGMACAREMTRLHLDMAGWIEQC